MRALAKVAALSAAAVVLVFGFTWSVRGATAPPTIDDLHNTRWEVTVSGTEYDLQGGSNKTSSTITWTLTKLDADRVHIENIFGGMVSEARYQSGRFLQSYSSAETPAKDGSLLQAVVSGTPGKMKMKGQYTIFSVDDSFEVLRVYKLTAKQVPAP